MAILRLHRFQLAAPNLGSLFHAQPWKGLDNAQGKLLFAQLMGAEALKPLISAIVTVTLAQVEAARAALPDKLAFGEAEAARLLSLERHQLRDARLRGEIAASVGPKRTILYRREDLTRYLASRPWLRGSDKQ